MQVNIRTACELLLKQDHIVILAHQKPDGDTLGSCFALLYALEALGKTARVESPDGFPRRYSFIYGDYAAKEFAPAYVVSADVASLQLLGGLAEVYGGRVNLCIDHHKSNTMPAEHVLLDAAAPAAAQIMREVIAGLGAQMTKPIANAIYTGLSTDTGCFKYPNVTPETHRVAAEMIEAGAEHGSINKLLFDTKSKGHLEIERQLIGSLEYYFDGQCAVMAIPAGIAEKYGVSEEELDGISALPRRIEGVKAGVTIRIRGDNAHRISLRSGDGVDASKICVRMGGGGHAAAAGCTIQADCQQAKEIILAEIEKELELLRA